MADGVRWYRDKDAEIQSYLRILDLSLGDSFGEKSDKNA